MKKPITCCLCNFSACYGCFSKFMLECTVTAKCMKCDKPWTRKHLVDSFGQYFVSHKYKQKRENVLFDLEKAMLPDTQPLAVRAKKLHEINKTISNYSLEVDELQKTLRRLDYDMVILDSEFEEFLLNRKTLRMQIHNLQEEIGSLVYRRRRITENAPTRNEKKSNTLVVKCPSETCRGYINVRKSPPSCDMCKTVICADCHEVVDKDASLDNGTPLDKDGSLDSHTCNPATKETVALLKKDSKNCPSCKSIIYKIDGCDQMFCTQCHTAFSWRTGEISVGRIHNPHYYEYLRQTGGQVRELGDVPCGGLPRLTREILDNKFLSKVHRVASHFEFYEIPRYQNDLNYVHGNVNLRILYLNGDIDETAFKREIYRREKALEKKREILTIVNTFVIVVADLFRGKVTDHTQYETIRNFTRENLMDVSRVYKCTVPDINSAWELGTYRYGKV